MTVDEALAALRDHVDADVLIELASRVVEANEATAGPDHRGRERHVVADLRSRAGRVHDAEMGDKVRVGTPPRS